MSPFPTSDRPPLDYAPLRSRVPWWLLPLAVATWATALLSAVALATLIWSYFTSAKPLPGTLATPLLGLLILVLVPIAALLTRAALASQND